VSIAPPISSPIFDIFSDPHLTSPNYPSFLACWVIWLWGRPSLFARMPAHTPYIATGDDCYDLMTFSAPSCAIGQQVLDNRVEYTSGCNTQSEAREASLVDLLSSAYHEIKHVFAATADRLLPIWRPVYGLMLALGVTCLFDMPNSARSENLYVKLEYTGGYNQSNNSAINDNFTFRLGSFTLDPDTKAADIATLLTGNNAVANLTDDENFEEFGTLAWGDRDVDNNLAFEFDAAALINRDVFLLIFNKPNTDLTNATQLGVFRFFDVNTPITFPDRTGGSDEELPLALVTESDEFSEIYAISFFGNLQFNDSSNTTTILAEAAGGLAVTSGNPEDGVQGSVYGGYTIAANFDAISFSASGLPSGLLVRQATGEIYGTPLESGDFDVTLTARHPLLIDLSKTVTLKVAPALGNPPVLTNPGNLSLVRTADFSLDISATENPTSYSLTGDVPLGLTINNQGQIRGSTTASPKSYSVTVTATNPGGSDSETFSLLLTNPTITPSTTTVNGLLNVAISQVTMTRSSGTTATFSATLPEGLSINPITGTITGTPTREANSTTSIIANFGNSVTASADIQITIISPRPALLPLASGEADLTRGTSVNLLLEIDPATGSVGTYTYSMTGDLPPGIKFDQSDGKLTGSPTSLGAFPVTFTVSNSGGVSVGLPVTFTVEAPTPRITSKLFVSAGVYVPFNYIISSNDTHTYRFEGAPSWLTYYGNTLSGRPTSASSTPILVTLVAETINRAGNVISDRKTLQITVAAKPPDPSSFSFGNGNLRVGVPVGATDADGFFLPGYDGFFLPGSDQTDNSTTYFNATGLPPGLKFGRKWKDDDTNLDPLVGSWIDDRDYMASARRRGLITGTPTRAGVFPITVYIQNGKGYTKKTHTLTVLP
jgi:hypothetical protein